MRPGDVIDGRWSLVAEAAAGRDVARWRAQDVSTGEPVEILVARPGSRAAAFTSAHRHLGRARDPALAATRAIIDTPDGPAVVRDPLEDATAMDLRGPLAPGIVAAIGARLLPAVLAAGAGTGGTLTPVDVGLDAAGRPVLAPRGMPATEVRAADAAWAPPEAFAGKPPDAAAALFGLGVLLYQLATGSMPRTRRPGAVYDPVVPSPPSTLRRDVPKRLDEAILRLLSTDPSDRAGALPLLQDAAQPLPDLRYLLTDNRPDGPALKPVSIPAGEVKLTTSATRHRSRGREDAAPDEARGQGPTPRFAVVIDDVGALDGSRRHAAAAVAGVPMSTVDALGRSGAPLVLGGGRRRHAAALVEELADLDLPVRTASPPSPVWPLAAVASLLLVIPAAALGLVFWPLALTALLPALLSAILVVVYGIGLLQHRGIRSTWRANADDRARVAQDGELGRVWRRVGELRIALARAGIPDAIATDLRTGLRDVESRLESLDTVGNVASTALSSVDLDRLRTRLDGFGAEPSDERERLARTIADLEAVEARRRQLDDELSTIDDALDEVAAVLVRLDHGEMPTERALESLRRTTQLTRQIGAETRPTQTR